MHPDGEECPVEAEVVPVEERLVAEPLEVLDLDAVACTQTEATEEQKATYAAKHPAE